MQRRYLDLCRLLDRPQAVDGRPRFVARSWHAPPDRHGPPPPRRLRRRHPTRGQGPPRGLRSCPRAPALRPAWWDTEDHAASLLKPAFVPAPGRCRPAFRRRRAPAGHPAGRQVCYGVDQMSEVAAEAVELPDHEHAALRQGAQAQSVETRPVVAKARGEVVVEVDRVVDAGRPQGVAPQVQASRWSSETWAQPSNMVSLPRPRRRTRLQPWSPWTRGKLPCDSGGPGRNSPPAVALRWARNRTGPSGPNRLLGHLHWSPAVPPPGRPARWWHTRERLHDQGHPRRSRDCGLPSGAGNNNLEYRQSATGRSEQREFCSGFRWLSERSDDTGGKRWFGCTEECWVPSECSTASARPSGTPEDTHRGKAELTALEPTRRGWSSGRAGTSGSAAVCWPSPPAHKGKDFNYGDSCWSETDLRR